MNLDLLGVISVLRSDTRRETSGKELSAVVISSVEEKVEGQESVWICSKCANIVDEIHSGNRYVLRQKRWIDKI